MSTWVEFTKPTLNYAKGDVVELDDEQKEMLDTVIKKRFSSEEDGGRDRYKSVAKPTGKKADAKVSTVVSGTTVEQTAGGRTADKANENDTAKERKAAEANVGDKPPVQGAGK